MKSEKEKMLAGELYLSDEQLKREHARAKELTFEFNNSRPGEIEKRKEIISRLLLAKGSFRIEAPFHCDFGYNIELGDNFYANYGCVILDVNRVIIGRDVMFGPYVQIYSATHPTEPDIRLTGKELGKPVVIGDNVWLGGGTVVCPGVTIGDNVSIGAGSVVSRDIPDNVVAVGNPCRVLRPA